MWRAERYAERQSPWHGRLIHALRTYGDDSTSVGDALRRAAADLGVGADGRGFEAVAELVVAAAEAREAVPAGMAASARLGCDQLPSAERAGQSVYQARDTVEHRRDPQTPRTRP